jgi:hypothetical protein
MLPALALVPSLPDLSFLTKFCQKEKGDSSHILDTPEMFKCVNAPQNNTLYADIFLKKLRKTMKNLSLNKLFLC